MQYILSMILSPICPCNDQEGISLILVLVVDNYVYLYVVPVIFFLLLPIKLERLQSHV